VTIPELKALLDRVYRNARITTLCIYRYVLATVGWSLRAVVSTYRLFPESTQSIRAAVSAYRFAPERMQDIRAAISAHRRLLDRMQSVRAAPSAYRFVPDRMQNARAISAYRFVPERTQSIRAAYHRLLDGMQGIRAATAAYRSFLDRMHRLQAVPSVYRFIPDRLPSIRIISAYRFVPERMQRIQTGISAYHDLLDSIQSVRATTSTYRFVPDGMQHVGAISTYRFVPNRMQSVRAISAYRFVPDRLPSVRAISASPVVPERMRSVRAAISAYHLLLDLTRPRVRLAIPLIYRHVLDAVDRGARATFSFPSFRYGVIAIAALGVLAPLSLVLYQSFLTAPFSDSNARFGLDAYQFILADKAFGVAFGTSLLLGTATTLIAVPVGAMFAFLVGRTDVPGRRWLEPLILLPIFLPTLVLAFGYVEALGPAGILTKVFNDRIGVVPWNVYSLAFLVAVAGLTHVPYVYLYVAAALRRFGADHEEAACSAGAGPWRVAFGVSLPLTMPSISVAAALVFFLGFELFGLPLILGDDQGTLALSTYLYSLSTKATSPPTQLMAAVIAIMVAIGLPLLLLQRTIPSAWWTLSLDPPRPSSSTPCRLRFWGVPAFLVIALWFAVTVLVPLAALTLRSFAATSFAENWSEGITLSKAFTIEHYRQLLEHPGVLRSIINTLAIGILGSAAAAALYIGIVIALHRWRLVWSQTIEYLVLVPRAMPELAAGLALLWVLLFFRPLTSLRETLISVWLAYTFVWLACGMQIVSSVLLKVDRRLEDAARIVGATEARMKLDVTLPLMRDGLLAGWLLIFLIFARDYSTGIYLLASGNEVIGPLLVSLWGSGATDLVSALSVIQVVMIGVGLFIAIRFGVRLHA
jgi:iron(III) transport system permease protein